MAGGPIWYELMTPDVPGAIEFYRAVGGWEIPADGMAMPNGVEYRMIVRPDGGNLGGLLKLTDGMIAGGAAPGWMPYFHVDDVAATVAKATALGAKIHMPPTTMEAGTMAMLSDQQGAPFYVMTPTPPPGQPDAKSDVFDEKKTGHCRWNELSTTDAPAALEFYTALLGWVSPDKMPMGERGDYFFLRAEDVRIGAISPWLHEGQPPMWLFYLGVDDIDRAHAAAKANGGTSVGDPHEVPGGDYVFSAHDPAGARIAFVGTKGE